MRDTMVCISHIFFAQLKNGLVTNSVFEYKNQLFRVLLLWCGYIETQNMNSLCFHMKYRLVMIQREIKGEMIKRVVTRFKYEAEKVVFEILLRLHHIDNTVLVVRTYNYESFKKSYDGLKIAKQKNTTIILPQSGFNESWLEQAA